MSSLCGTHQEMNSKTSLSCCRIGISITSSKLQGFIVSAHETHFSVFLSMCVFFCFREIFYSIAPLYLKFFCANNQVSSFIFWTETTLNSFSPLKMHGSHGHFMRIPLEFVNSIYSLICSKKCVQFSTFCPDVIP